MNLQLQEADSEEKLVAFSNLADLYDVMEQSGCDTPLKVFMRLSFLVNGMHRLRGI